MFKSYNVYKKSYLGFIRRIVMAVYIAQPHVRCS